MDLDIVEQATVSVIQHPKKGLVAQVSATPINSINQAVFEERIKEASGGFTVKYKLV